MSLENLYVFSIGLPGFRLRRLSGVPGRISAFRFIRRLRDFQLFGWCLTSHLPTMPSGFLHTNPSRFHPYVSLALELSGPFQPPLWPSLWPSCQYARLSTNLSSWMDYGVYSNALQDSISTENQIQAGWLRQMVDTSQGLDVHWLSWDLIISGVCI